MIMLTDSSKVLQVFW